MESTTETPIIQTEMKQEQPAQPIVQLQEAVAQESQPSLAEQTERESATQAKADTLRGELAQTPEKGDDKAPEKKKTKETLLKKEKSEEDELPETKKFKDIYKDVMPLRDKNRVDYKELFMFYYQEVKQGRKTVSEINFERILLIGALLLTKLAGGLSRFFQGKKGSGMMQAALTEITEDLQNRIGVLTAVIAAVENDFGAIQHFSSDDKMHTQQKLQEKKQLLAELGESEKHPKLAPILSGYAAIEDKDEKQKALATLLAGNDAEQTAAKFITARRDLENCIGGLAKNLVGIHNLSDPSTYPPLPQRPGFFERVRQRMQPPVFA